MFQKQLDDRVTFEQKKVKSKSDLEDAVKTKEEVRVEL